MEFQTGFFYLFSAVLLFAAFRTVTARSPVHAVLYLMLAFSQAAAIWLLLKAEFLGITLVLVYLGAVMVLFLFVVMMLDINIDSIRQGFWKHFPAAGLVGALIAVEMAFVLLRGFDRVDAKAMAPDVAKLANTKALGVDLYTNYLFPVQIAAVILLVAIIAAIALTLRRRKDSHYQNPSEQVRVKKADRLRIMKVAAEVEVPVAAPADASNNGGQA